MAIIGAQDFGDGRLFLEVDHDPTAVSTDALAGSIIVNSAGLLYRKTVDGDNTSVERIGDFLADGTVPMAASLQMGSNTITGVANGVIASDAVNKSQLDAIAAGITWKDPVCTVGLVGNNTVATINGLSPTAGDAYVMTDAGTLTAGALVVAIGDLVEYNGSSWIKLETNSGGFPPDGTRVTLSTTTALISPYTDTTDDGKIGDFDGTSLTATLTAPLDGDAVLVDCDSGLNTNNGFVFDTGTTTWVKFTGLGQVTARDALTKTGNILDLDPGDGIEIVGGGGSGGAARVKSDVTTGGDVAAASVSVNGVGLDVNNLDGDHLSVDFTPSNYTPDATPPEAADVDDLAAHLQGIDTKLGSAGFVSNTVATTDATTTTIATLAITDDTVNEIEVHIQGRRTNGDADASYILVGVFDRRSGALTQIGPTRSQTFEDTGAKTWKTMLTISGTNVLVQVKGKATHNVNWKSEHRHLVSN